MGPAALSVEMRMVVVWMRTVVGFLLFPQMNTNYGTKGIGQ
jgi:hypothetical protein